MTGQPIRPTSDEIAAMDLPSLHGLRKDVTRRISGLARAIAAAALGEETARHADNGTADPAPTEAVQPTKPKRKPSARSSRVRDQRRPARPKQPEPWEVAVDEADRALWGMDIRTSGIEVLLRARQPLSTREVAERAMKDAGRAAGDMAMRGIGRRLSIVLFHLWEKGYLEKSGSPGRSEWKARPSLGSLRGR